MGMIWSGRRTAVVLVGGRGGVCVAAERMTAVDHTWLRMDQPTNRMVVHTVLWFAGPVDWAAARAALAERLVEPFPRFRQRVRRGGLGGPEWVDDPDFALDRHVVTARLPGPGGPEELHAYVGDQLSQALPPDRPLWQVHLVDGYRDGAAMLLRTHHAIADGTALVQVLLSLADPGPDGTGPAGRLRLVDRPAEPALAVAGRTAGALARGYATLLGGRGVAKARSAAGMLAKLGGGRRDDDTLLRAPLGVPKKVTWSAPMPLATVKAAARRFDGTVNDVTLAVIAGGLRRYLAEHGEQAERLTAVVPYNVRPPGAPLPRQLGNEFGLVFVALPVGAGEPAERMAAVKRQMDEIKSSGEAPLVYGALGAMGYTFAEVERRWVDRFAGRASVVVTNVAGPAEPVSFAGTRVGGFMAWVPMTGPIGIGVSIVSYAGQVLLGIAVDAQHDPDRLLTAIRDEIREIAGTG
jgi:diacylglycerol O-acyltransferase / wax synthase